MDFSVFRLSLFTNYWGVDFKKADSKILELGHVERIARYVNFFHSHLGMWFADLHEGNIVYSPSAGVSLIDVGNWRRIPDLNNLD